jgi:UDP-2,4-diacetamido-2,4,6-trideoxy-beta-L-altropyranose hydrolase
VARGTSVVVVCDAASTTGLGHFVRCTALATALARSGAGIRFLLPGDTVPPAVERVHRAGWAAAVGDRDPAAVAGDAGPGAVVVLDTYRVDGGWIDELADLLHASGSRLAVVDDAADRSFRADLVLNQNVGTEQLPYPGAGQVLAGPRYALLRPDFPRLRPQGLASLDSLPDRPATVLVLFGGTDATGMAVPAAEAARRAFPDARVRAVLPAGAPAGDAGVEWLGHVDAIAAEMLAADLVVSAGGSTLWELCCLARPSAVVAVADNQRSAYDWLSHVGAILPVGREPERDVDTLADRLRRVVAAPGTLRSTALRAASITDGEGADRVAAALLALDGASGGEPDREA